MNDKKIAFITCVNDEIKYAECRFYLNRLIIPKDYMVDIISIRDAHSMAAGYNAAMRDSDAKYKIYLHQDVFIKNCNFLSDILKIFFSNRDIGMLGMIGRRETGTTALEMSEWDVGSVIYDYQTMKRDFPKGNSYIETTTIDGLLMATQYDILWREDIFDGWDFYDFSQCMEFKKKGYKVAVPYQEDIWCCHDGLSSNLTAYFDYYEKFFQEYIERNNSRVRSSEELFSYKINKEYAQKIVVLKKEIEGLFDAGGRSELRQLFDKADFQNNVHLREYKSIIHIDQTEEEKQSERRFWVDGMSASSLISKLRILKYALRRIEYGADDVDRIEIWKDYSGYAVKDVVDHFLADKNIFYKKLKLFG